MTIDSGRIVLRALTPSEAEATVAERRVGQKWAWDYPTLGDLNVAKAALAGAMAYASEVMPWGLYVVVEKSSGLSIGGIGFKSAPNERGEVEIGYGICASYQGRGHATEAVEVICGLARDGASVIVAETERANVASQRVLEKCGFHIVADDDGLLRWRRSFESPVNKSESKLSP